MRQKKRKRKFYRPIHTLFTGRSIFIETNYRKTKKTKRRTKQIFRDLIETENEEQVLYTEEKRRSIFSEDVQMKIDLYLFHWGVVVWNCLMRTEILAFVEYLLDFFDRHLENVRKTKKNIEFIRFDVYFQKRRRTIQAKALRNKNAQWRVSENNINVHDKHNFSLTYKTKKSSHSQVFCFFFLLSLFLAEVFFRSSLIISFGICLSVAPTHRNLNK